MPNEKYIVLVDTFICTLVPMMHDLITYAAYTLSADVSLSGVSIFVTVSVSFLFLAYIYT